MSSPGASAIQRFHPAPLLRMTGCLASSACACSNVLTKSEPHQALRNWAKGILRFLRVDVEVVGELPQWPQLWVANHLSWIDPVVLLSLRPSIALAKAEVGGYPLLGRGAKNLGLAFVKREDPLSRAAAIVRLTHEIRSGAKYLVFPEGTTTYGESLSTLQEGSLRTAYRLNASVLPIRLSSDASHYPWVGDAGLLPHVWTLAKAERTYVRVEGRRLLHPSDFASEEHWLASARHELMP